MLRVIRSGGQHKKRLNASFGSTDELYMRSEAPDLPNESHGGKTPDGKVSGFNAQLLIWSPDTLSRYGLPRAISSPREGGCSARQCSVNLVRYVLSNYPYGAKDSEPAM